MNSTAGRIASLLLMAAVLVYTVANYLTGRSPFGYVVVAFLVIGLPMLNSIKLMLEEHNNKDK